MSSFAGSFGCHCRLFTAARCISTLFVFKPLKSHTQTVLGHASSLVAHKPPSALKAMSPTPFFIKPVSFFSSIGFGGETGCGEI